MWGFAMVDTLREALIKAGDALRTAEPHLAAGGEEWRENHFAQAAIGAALAAQEHAAEELAITNKLLELRESVLRAIPECPVHGADCVPHALEWVEKAKAALAAQEQAELVHRYDVMEALRRALNKLPRYSFWLGEPASVRKVPERHGAWIEWQAAHELFDAEVLDHLLGSQPPAAQPVAVPAGYALVSESALRAWGKLDLLRAACIYPIAAAPAAPAQAQPLTPDANSALVSSLLEMIGRISDALGISEEEQECGNGDLEILAAIRELKEREPLTDAQWLKRRTAWTGRRLPPGPERERFLQLVRFAERSLGIGQPAGNGGV